MIYVYEKCRSTLDYALKSPPSIREVKYDFRQTRDDESSLSQAKEITSNAFEISLSKNYGRIHGFIWNNTCHIVWFDPAHNLYPMKQGITRHVDAAVVKCFSPREKRRTL